MANRLHVIVILAVTLLLGEEKAYATEVDSRKRRPRKTMKSFAQMPAG